MENKNLFIIGSGLIVLFLVLLYVVINQMPKESVPDMTNTKSQANTTTEDTTKSSMPISNGKNGIYKKAPDFTINKNKTYQATLKTSKGDIKIDLDAKNAPNTVNNFVFLAKAEFYNNTIFHRIMKNFMIQGGDPTGTGRGGPGYQFNNENDKAGYARGTVAMANAGKNTNGSQFFIMHASVGLSPDYSVFGKVSEADSLKVLDEIATTPTSFSDSGEQSKPKEQINLLSVEITEK